MERKKKHKKKNRHSYNKSEEPAEFRVRLPRGREVIGIVEVRLGMGKSRIRCTDGKTRICRVPGALKRRLWVRAGDTILIEPWEFGGDSKGNIVFKYTANQAQWLRNKGYLKDLIEMEEF